MGDIKTIGIELKKCATHCAVAFGLFFLPDPVSWADHLGLCSNRSAPTHTTHVPLLYTVRGHRKIIHVDGQMLSQLSSFL